MSDSSGISTGIIESIRELTASRKQIPTMSEFVNHTDWEYKDIEQTFQNWAAAIEAAGIDYEASLLTELQNVAAQVGHQPTPDEMDDTGRYSSGMFESVFGSWDAAIDQAELAPEDNMTSTSSTNSDTQSNKGPETPVKVTDDDSGILASIKKEFDSEGS